MRAHPFMALLSKDSPRFAAWEKVFGDGQIPIQSPVSAPAMTPIGRREVYLVALDALDETTRQRLWQHLGERFGTDPAMVQRVVAEEGGLPIIAEDVIVRLDLRYVL